MQSWGTGRIVGASGAEVWWRESSWAGRCSGDEWTVRGKEGSGAPFHRGETEDRKSVV